MALNSTAQAPERLFFALWPNDAMRAQIAARAQALQPPAGQRGRPVASGNYHLTLRFLGQFAPLPAPVVDAAMAAGDAQHLPGFDLMLDRAGSFDGGRVWWIGPSKLPGPLQALVGGLDAALARLDAAGAPARGPAGDFVAHVTLGRNAATPPEGAIEPLLWQVDGFALLASGGRHSGYRTLAQWPLQPRGVP